MEYSRLYDFGVKDMSDDAPGRFQGYASVFGPPADLQGDIIVPNAFRSTLKESKGKVPILMSHIMSRVVGFGIDAEEDDRGLKVTGEFTMDSDEGRNAYALVKHASRVGHKMGLSIGYMIDKNGADYDEASGVRTIRKISLLEYSLAAVPAAPRARLTSVKAATLRELERYLRQTGMTGDQAREFISMCKAERDAKPDDINSGPERDAKDLDRSKAFMAELRQMDIHFQMIRSL